MSAPIVAQSGGWMASRRRQRQIKMGLAWLGVAFFLTVALFPIYWMIATSFKLDAEMYTINPTFFPIKPTLRNFTLLFKNQPFATQLWNSFFISGFVTMLSVAFGALAAYSLTRLRYPGRDVISGAVFFVYLVPASLLVIPMYILIDYLDLVDTYSSLILAYLTFTVPFSTWMMKGYFETIPVDLEEAAMVDGASRLVALIRITLPLAGPGLVAAAIFTFTLSWNEYLFALVFISEADLKTAPVGLAALINQDVFLWGQIMAGAMIMSIPIVTLYILAQRFVVTGLTAGAVKG